MQAWWNAGSGVLAASVRCGTVLSTSSSQLEQAGMLTLRMLAVSAVSMWVTWALAFLFFALHTWTQRVFCAAASTRDVLSLAGPMIFILE